MCVHAGAREREEQRKEEGRGGEERVRRTQAGLGSDARAASRRPPGLKRALVAVRGNCTQRGEKERAGEWGMFGAGQQKINKK